MLNDILTDTHILLDKSVSDWKEAVKTVAEPLLADKCISGQYVQAMIDTVKKFGAYMVIAKGVALAHARPEEGVYKGALSVLTLNKPIYFGHTENDPVKIVFCLAAVDNTAHLAIIQELVQVINKQERLNQLASTKELTVFRNLLLLYEQS